MSLTRTCIRALSSSSALRVGVVQKASTSIAFRNFVTSRPVYSASDNRLCKDELDSPSPKVLNLADEVISLNLLEINQLMRYLQKRLGVHAQFYAKGWASFGGGGGGGGGAKAGGGAAAAAEAPKEKDAFDLKLTEVPAGAKIKIIKEVRAITGLGLKEAKEMVESSPVVIKKGLKKDEAAKLMATIVEVGGKAELL
mmetsp:Transcript_7528/g.15203  ORF Transcript_7528/g.15203 Transcript_7528/m.15203 type:complete len:197 (-) Transcript_7528:6-596(-)